MRESLNIPDDITAEFFCCDVSRAAQAEKLAAEISARLNAAISKKGSASIAFSGGSTPKLMFAELAKRSLDWSKVHITLVDERCVDIDNARSNAKLLRDNLIDALPGTPIFYPLFLSEETIDQRSTRLAAFPLPFDVVHLGMGGDAHTASFFPDAKNVAEMIDPGRSELIGETQSENSVELRLTWTLSALRQSEFICLQICGEEKIKVLSPIINLLDSGEVAADDFFSQQRLKFPVLSVLQLTRLVLPAGIPLSIYYADK